MKKTKIIAFGTFDGLHPGHFDFFRQAKKLAPNSFLIISVARDENVKKIKGQKPDLSEKKRLTLVKKSKHIDKAVLASRTNYLSHILAEKPEIIALGYDQRAYVAELKRDLKKKKLTARIVRLKSYKKQIYKNHLLKKKSKI